MNSRGTGLPRSVFCRRYCCFSTALLRSSAMIRGEDAIHFRQLGAWDAEALDAIFPAVVQQNPASARRARIEQRAGKQPRTSI
jgi:hypothetical protein